MWTTRTRQQVRSWSARWLFCALVLGLAAPAGAEDFDYPPVSPIPIAPPGSVGVGPATYTRWSGFYFGGQFGLGIGNADFSTATQSGLAYALRETLLETDFAPSQWPVLGTADNSALSYGGFFGYNTQWENVIVGIEANLSKTNLTLDAPSTPLSRNTSADSAGNVYALALSGSGSVANMWLGTLRITAGYVAGNFMPYAFFGPALGLTNTSVTATIAGEEYTSGTVGTCSAKKPCYPFSLSSSDVFSNQLQYGYTAGLGVNIAITPNLFLRAEFEWDQFNLPPGILMSVTTGRVGAGLKF